MEFCACCLGVSYSFVSVPTYRTVTSAEDLHVSVGVNQVWLMWDGHAARVVLLLRACC